MVVRYNGIIRWDGGYNGGATGYSTVDDNWSAPPLDADSGTLTISTKTAAVT
jgi:hypothetical protein